MFLLFAFSETIKGRAINLGSCIHLEVNAMFNIETWPTFYGSLTNVEFLRLGDFLRTYKGLEP